MCIRGAWVASSGFWSFFRHFTSGRCLGMIWGWTFGPEEDRSGTDSGTGIGFGERGELPVHGFFFFRADPGSFFNSFTATIIALPSSTPVRVS